MFTIGGFNGGWVGNHPRTAERARAKRTEFNLSQQAIRKGTRLKPVFAHTEQKTKYGKTEDVSAKR